MAGVVKYLDRLNKRKVLIKCPTCGDQMMLRMYRKHKCSPTADGNSNTKCPWCGEIDWPYGKMSEHLPHLEECMAKFVKNNMIKKKPEFDRHLESKLKFQELLDQFRECMRDAGDALILQHKLEMDIMRNILNIELDQVKLKLDQVLANSKQDTTGGPPAEYSFDL